MGCMGRKGKLTGLGKAGLVSSRARGNEVDGQIQSRKIQEESRREAKSRGTMILSAGLSLKDLSTHDHPILPSPPTQPWVRKTVPSQPLRLSLPTITPSNNHPPSRTDPPLSTHHPNHTNTRPTHLNC
jgi:hypothetical protein